MLIHPRPVRGNDGEPGHRTDVLLALGTDDQVRLGFYPGTSSDGSVAPASIHEDIDGAI
jgi:hypothetical protein